MIRLSVSLRPRQTSFPVRFPHSERRSRRMPAVPILSAGLPATLAPEAGLDVFFFVLSRPHGHPSDGTTMALSLVSTPESSGSFPRLPNRPSPADRRTLVPVSLVDDVDLPPLAGDLVRVEDRLNNAVRADDRFLGDVAGHLLGAGGKRLRPALSLCAGY